MKRWLSNVLITVFTMVFAVSGFFLGRYLLRSRQSQQQFQELTQIMEQARPAPQATESAPQDSEGITEAPQTDTAVQVLPEYAELYARNSDMAGWIAIADTSINYPVMHAPDRTDYYLYRDFYGQDSIHGSIYIREQCDPQLPSDHVVIYGHRMKDGSMFHDLLLFEKKSYYDAHKYITFNNLYQRHTYEIFAVFKTVAADDYYQFTNANDPQDFANFVFRCKEKSLYDTGVTAEYGDALISLTTCEYSQSNGRMVIVAKRIS